MLICAAAIGAGGVMAAGATVVFSVFMLGEPAGFAVVWSMVALAPGCVLGVCSLAYLLPLLWGTRTERSLPLVFGVSMAAGIGLGGLHPLLGAASALIAQLCTAGIAHAMWPAWRIFRGWCGGCGYDCRGLPGGLCPECGAAVPRERLWPEACVCEACEGGRLSARGRCERCGAVDFNRAAGIERGASVAAGVGGGGDSVFL